jgi:archaellum biogenesis ATPase FlaH
MKFLHLKKEHSLNKILKKQKAFNTNIKILFVSLWDSYSNNLLEKLEQTTKDAEKDIYVVDSFHMPHSFVIFNTSKLPHLVTLTGRKMRSVDYLPHIYEDLKVK